MVIQNVGFTIFHYYLETTSLDCNFEAVLYCFTYSQELLLPTLNVIMPGSCNLLNKKWLNNVVCSELMLTVHVTWCRIVDKLVPVSVPARHKFFVFLVPNNLSICIIVSG